MRNVILFSKALPAANAPIALATVELVADVTICNTSAAEVTFELLDYAGTEISEAVWPAGKSFYFKGIDLRRLRVWGTEGHKILVVGNTTD